MFALSKFLTYPLLLLAIACFLSPPVVKAAPNPSFCSWRLTFSDEFDGRQINTGKWSTESGSGGNGEQQRYVSDAVTLRNGILRLHAEKRRVDGYRYTSGIIATRQSFQQRYGYFEIRAKAPAGRGFWPGFWLLSTTPNRAVEIDVIELHGDKPNVAYLSHHWLGVKEEKLKKTYKIKDAIQGGNFQDDYHTFAVKWTPTEIIWYIDSVEQQRTSEGIPHEPLFLLANFAVGGRWPGNPDQSTPFPSIFAIDYIRVFAHSCPDGKTPPSTPEPQPSPPCAGLSQEAESGALSGQFVVGKDAKANTGKYIYTPNQGLFWEGPVAWQKASYCFNVENPGVYRILISVAAPDINSDSFYVQVDGAPAAGYLWDIALSQSYAIDYVNDRDHADPIELSLSFGQHIVAFYVREDGARLDRIQLEPVTLTDKEQVTFIPTQHATQVD